MNPGEISKRIRFKLSGERVRIQPRNKPSGYVLISYFTYPFLVKDPNSLHGHTNYWEVTRMVQEFTERNYTVDVIDASNKKFIPKENYSYFIDIHSNLERLASHLPKNCIKILFTTTSHWLFNNYSEYQRLYDLKIRRGAALEPERLLEPMNAEDYADAMIYFGNNKTLNTYNYKKIPLIKNIPISTTFTFPKPNKDFTDAKNGFIWLGGAGAIHKGVDLLIEAFADTKELKLELCGKYKSLALEKVYEQELKENNILGHGVVNLGSDTFKKINDRSAFIISPSCAEGQSGAVIVGMHAGLIPIVSKETGIDVGNFGFTLDDCSIETIKQTIKKCASLSAEELTERSIKSWEYANKHHTRENFTKTFSEFIDSLETKK